jgi:hypothetical protein
MHVGSSAAASCTTMEPTGVATLSVSTRSIDASPQSTRRAACRSEQRSTAIRQGGSDVAAYRPRECAQLRRTDASNASAKGSRATQESSRRFLLSLYTTQNLFDPNMIDIDRTHRAVPFASQKLSSRGCLFTSGNYPVEPWSADSFSHAEYDAAGQTEHLLYIN